MRARLTIAVVLWMAVGAAAVAGEAPRPMTAVDLLSVPTQGEVRVAPGGGAVLFVRTQTDWDQDKLVSHIWKVGADGAPLQMTNGTKGESAPRWSPDGRRFCFVATREGDTAQLYLQRVDGGEALQLTKHETSVSSPSWSPDGRSLLFLADDADSKEVKEAKKRSGDVISYDRDYHQKHLWAVDLESRAERRLTEGAFSVASYELSRDGATLVYVAAPTPLVDDQDEAEIYVRPLAGGEPRRLTSNGIEERSVELSPDGRTVLFVADTNERFEPYYQGKLFTVPVTGGPARLLLPAYQAEIQSAAWSADGDGVVVLVNSGVREHLHTLEAGSGRLRALTSGDGAVTNWDVDPKSGAYAVVIATPSSPGDVWAAPGPKSAPIRLTRFAEEVAGAFRLPRVEVVTWKGADGQAVEGILTYPLDWKAGQRYPLVIQTHGGPAASSTLRFPGWATYTPVLAAKGYLVLDPNYRGSTGYGDDFLRDMVGHYFHQADKDVLAGADALIERGLADPEKLATMGWSAGGHMTDWLVATTRRFKAAASGAGAANWISMYAQSDVRTYRTPWFGGTPWQADAPLKVYLENSPVTHVAGATTPTLILVGEKDVRVPAAQSIEMFRALRAVGVETELLVFPGEPHGLRTAKHRLHKVNSEIAWFEKHLFGRAYEAEKPPATTSDDGEKNGKR